MRFEFKRFANLAKTARLALSSLDDILTGIAPQTE